MKNLLLEALLVGIVVSKTIGFLIKSNKIRNVKLPPECESWNENNIMEISLFITGFLSHLLFEFLGANTWYCKNGNACL